MAVSISQFICYCERVFARRDTERSFNRDRVVNFSAFDDVVMFVDVPNVFRRITIHENHVS